MPAQSATLAWRALRTITWALAALVLALITLVATLRLSTLLAAAIGDRAGWYDGLGIAIVAAYLVGSAALILAVWTAASRPTKRSWLLPVVVIGVAIGVRAVLAVAFDAPLDGENGIIHRQALGVLDGANCCFSHRPMGYPLALAGAYTLLGIGPGAIEALNIACAAVTTWLAFDIGRVAWDRRVGLLSATTYAVVPSQVLLSLPPLTEPLYTTAVTAMVRLAIMRVPGSFLLAAAIGLSIAAAQYVRATAMSLLAPVVVLLLLTGEGVRRPVLQAGVTLAAFVVVMTPVIWFNVQTHGELSASTSAYAGWSLYVGANTESAGRFNSDDSAVFASLPGESAWERSEIAGELGIRRIVDDPLGFLVMQPRKFAVLWADESYAGSYAFSPAGAVATPETEIAWLLAQLFYVPILVFALLCVLFERSRIRPAALLMGMIISLVAATHVFLEVHSRYHAYVLPLLVVLAAGGVNTAVARYFNRRESSA